MMFIQCFEVSHKGELAYTMRGKFINLTHCMALTVKWNGEHGPWRYVPIPSEPGERMHETNDYRDQHTHLANSTGGAA